MGTWGCIGLWRGLRPGESVFAVDVQHGLSGPVNVVSARVITALSLSFQREDYAAGVIGYVTFRSYVYGVGGVFQPSNQRMAVYTAPSFFALSCGMLCVGSGRRFLGIFASPTTGGFVARRLLVYALSLLPVLGVMRLLGQRVSFYGTEVGLA